MFFVDRYDTLRIIYKKSIEGFDYSPWLVYTKPEYHLFSHELKLL